MDNMTAAPHRLPEFGEFLKARRTELTPRQVGLPDNGAQRRVAGLRREEVAQLAAISVDYYTRLEQGRVPASASVLMTLARALRLDDDQQTYLYELAGKTPARPRRRQPRRVRPAMQRLLDQLIETPAVVLGRRLDILAWNAGASALFTDFARIPASRRNYVRLLFTDPAMRSLHVDWENAARTAVASLRMEAAHDPDDPDLAVLVGELSVQDPDFRAWWASHQASSASYGTKHYRHPIVGGLTLDCDMWASPDGSGQRLMVLTAEPGTPTHEALRILASWTADASGLQPNMQLPPRAHLNDFIDREPGPGQQ
jgi:transcriptional regulator with XRE-family HTH domain